METSTITGKGQTTIPTRIRELLKIDTGDKLRYYVTESGEVILKSASGSVKDVRRVARAARQSLSDEEIQERMEKGVAEHNLS